MTDTQWRTHRLELDDQTLREWEGTVLAADAEGIVLDRSAFYPGGGGQPPDHGVLLWGGVQTRIVGARKGDEEYLIPAEGDPLPPAGTAVHGAVEDERRTALMRTHSGLHVLCGVVFRDYGALVTGGNMEPLTARMDFNLPELPEGFRDAVEAACNAEIRADRRIDVRVLPRDEAFALPDIIRTATNLVPPEVKEVRIIDIVGLDQQADGGTHVASTGQVGRIEVAKIESKGRGFRRLRIRVGDLSACVATMWTSGQARAADAAREPLDAAAVRAAVVRPDGLWRAVEVTELTGSTNADLLALAAAGAPGGMVLAAEQQSAGRGRLGRAWVAPPRAALTFSLLLRPRDVPRARHGWLPLLAGLATAEAVRAVTRVDARLKWPNDVLAGEGKFGGILAEATADAVVIGIGLNVSTEPGELPPPAPGSLAATSLRLAGSAGPDRGALLAAILAVFERRYGVWSSALGDSERSGLRADYTRLCATIGRQVRVELPGGGPLSGLATGVDADGRLLVRTCPGAEVPVTAGDVVHVR